MNDPHSSNDRMRNLEDGAPSIEQANICLMRHGPPRQPPKVDGWPITLPNQTEALEAIVRSGTAGESFAVFTLNLDHLVKLRRNKAFQNAYRCAQFVTADGAPVARLARRQGPPVERTTGADLVLPLADACARHRLPVFLFGTTPGVLAIAGQKLSEYAGSELDIVGSLSPPKDFDPEGPAADAALARIAQSGARICYVALGAPKQELFAARALAKGIKVGFICIGASLDFLAGEQVRAPRAFQKAGLEWLWRLGTNPRRLTLRYAQCAVLLAELTLFQPLYGPPSRRGTP
jgi:exopolysaccharide biosynthesis WecB/TagA/CpsF family protein